MAMLEVGRRVLQPKPLEEDPSLMVFASEEEIESVFPSVNGERAVRLAELVATLKVGTSLVLVGASLVLVWYYGGASWC